MIAWAFLVKQANKIGLGATAAALFYFINMQVSGLEARINDVRKTIEIQMLSEKTEVMTNVDSKDKLMNTKLSELTKRQDQIYKILETIDQRLYDIAKGGVRE